MVDDDQTLQSLYAEIFTQFNVVFASDGAAALYQLVAERPILILLDLVLPDIDGLVLISVIRKTSAVPIIMVSARAGQADRVLGLRAGADDFVPKPFDLDELEARVDVVLRRTKREPVPVIPVGTVAFGRLTISAPRGAIFDGKALHLTPIEYGILVALIENGIAVTSRADLAHAVWHYSDSSTNHLVDVHIGRMRKKLRTLGKGVPSILTVRRDGFRMAIE